MIRVLFVWYLAGPGAREQRFIASMSAVPRIGDGVSLGEDVPIMDVRRVLWTPTGDEPCDVEITLGTRS